MSSSPSPSLSSVSSDELPLSSSGGGGGGLSSANTGTGLSRPPGTPAGFRESSSLAPSVEAACCAAPVSSSDSRSSSGLNSPAGSLLACGAGRSSMGISSTSISEPLSSLDVSSGGGGGGASVTKVGGASDGPADRPTARNQEEGASVEQRCENKHRLRAALNGARCVVHRWSGAVPIPRDSCRCKLCCSRTVGGGGGIAGARASVGLSSHSSDAALVSAEPPSVKRVAVSASSMTTSDRAVSSWSCSSSEEPTREWASALLSCAAAAGPAASGAASAAAAAAAAVAIAAIISNSKCLAASGSAISACADKNKTLLSS